MIKINNYHLAPPFSHICKFSNEKDFTFPQLRINQGASPSVEEAFQTESSAILSEMRIPIIKNLTFTQDGGQLGASGEFKNGPQWQTTAKEHSV